MLTKVGYWLLILALVADFVSIGQFNAIAGCCQYKNSCTSEMRTDCENNGGTYYPNGICIDGRYCAIPVGAPAITQWGLVAIGALLAGSLAWMIRRRSTTKPAGA